VLGIRLDQFDHQVEFVGAVDFSRNAVVGVWLQGVGFGEVMQAINTASGMVEHHEDRSRAVFRPREQGEMVGAEVEHRDEGERERGKRSRLIGSAVEEFTRRTPPVRAIAQSGA
jgi:hypothetical protein